MAFADPQSVKISGVTTSLPRVSTGKYESLYRSADGNIELLASTSEGKRVRATIRINHKKITADPFIPTTNVSVGSSIYLVFDSPVVGYTDAELKAVYDGFIEALQATSSLLVTKLLGGES
ncbi:TPA_asm: coat protein [ssRNA phage Esthiorhiza.2_10]|uniref:Coat protein n=2 Tax=Leviviricetes TaxID=2842243 RepID=A0A8S5KX86_9VIRU|nr:coat protein [ssRNA phage Esthiorhiza.2_10]QDH87624.1 MAG: hypothetical protein H2RhizoLitter491218_000002 [Leviviridae sp.]DAD49958.1 TPA_asm: coat protein [ssRNA phage Esthiorhiza.2_10]